PDEMRGRLFRLIGLRGVNAVHEARELVGDIEELGQFEALLDLLNVYGLEYQVDLGIARGLDYYTGMVFEIYCEGLGAQNQVCGGGSYRLAKLFGGEDMPSTGYALGFDRIMEVCEVKYQPKIRVSVICFDDTKKEAITIAKKMRDELKEENIIVYSDLVGRKFKAQLTHVNSIDNSRYEQVGKIYGNKDNIELDKTFAVIVGADEVQNKRYQLKDMALNKQELLTTDEIVLKLRLETKELKTSIEQRRILGQRPN
ncbi:MAG: ATP phosphoribosyltransferase regulatory subunit, partial [Candidatus Methanoperedens sp.]